MQPNENGRFCASCQKTVKDFTNSTNEEILAYLKQQSGKRVCGTFKNSQLQAPVSYQYNEKALRFLAALLLVFGMSLFSCNTAEPDEKESKEQAEKEGNHSVLDGPIVSGEHIPEYSDSVSLSKQRSTTIQNTTQLVVEPIIESPALTTGEVSLPDEPGTIKVRKNDSTTVFEFADVMAEYPGGASQLMSFVATTVNYPKTCIDEGIQGTVYVSFVVMTDGKISEIKLLRGINEALDKEALRVVALLPPFIPARNAGKPVKVRYNLPIKFRIK